jgi:hypothetical protein
MAGMTRTVYVREDDVALWERAEAFARARRVPMSGLILLALEKYLEDQGSQRDA